VTFLGNWGQNVTAADLPWEPNALRPVSQPMHGTTQEPLLARADAAIEEARKLQAELSENVARAYVICRQADRAAAFQAGLIPTVAIALLVTERLRRPYGPSSLGKRSCILRPRNVSEGTPEDFYRPGNHL
jgi:hypothetical protein